MDIKPQISWVRLSEVIWRSGLASSKSKARQLLAQGAISVEGRDGVHRVTDELAVMTAEGIVHREATHD